LYGICSKAYDFLLKKSYDFVSLMVLECLTENEVRSCAYEKLTQMFKGDFRSFRFVLGQVQLVAINLGLIFQSCYNFILDVTTTLSLFKLMKS
jgi:hypothetical protein